MRKENNRVKRVSNKVNLQLDRIEPLTANQALVLNSESNVVAHGYAGTGKTFLAMYCGLHDILVKDLYKRLTIIRSAVPTRKEGFLPGTDKEKSEVYQRPYKDIAFELFDRADAYDQLNSKFIIDFQTTSYIRGNNIRDSVILVDECQNMTIHELDSIITRVGDNCRIFFCGDMLQNGDLGNEVSGLGEFFDIVKKMNEFDFVQFQLEDIVRSGLVKSYLMAKYGK